MEEECNQENYILQGSFDEKTWIDLDVFARCYITSSMLKPYAKFPVFRMVSDVTNQVLQKAYNTAAKRK